MKGQFFLIVQEGRIVGQGQIANQVSEGRYLCRFFGNTPVNRVVPADAMDQWFFFDNQDQAGAFVAEQERLAKEAEAKRKEEEAAAKAKAGGKGKTGGRRTRKTNPAKKDEAKDSDGGTGAGEIIPPPADGADPLAD